MLTVAIVIATSIWSIAHAGIIFPRPMPPPMQMVPVIPMFPLVRPMHHFGGILEATGPTGKYGGMIGTRGLAGKYGGMIEPFSGMQGNYGGGMQGNYGCGFGAFGGQGLYNDPGMMCMGMNDVNPGMGSYQYHQYTYDPTWNMNLQGGTFGGQYDSMGSGWNYPSYQQGYPVTGYNTDVKTDVNTGLTGQGSVATPTVNTGTGSSVVWSWNEPSTNLKDIGLQSH